MAKIRKHWIPNNGDQTRYYLQLPNGAMLGQVYSLGATINNPTPCWSWQVYMQNGVHNFAPAPIQYDGGQPAQLPQVVTEPTCEHAMIECEKAVRETLLQVIKDLDGPAIDSEE